MSFISPSLCWDASTVKGLRLLIAQDVIAYFIDVIVIKNITGIINSISTVIVSVVVVVIIAIIIVTIIIIIIIVSMCEST